MLILRQKGNCLSSIMRLNYTLLTTFSKIVLVLSKNKSLYSIRSASAFVCKDDKKTVLPEEELAEFNFITIYES